MKCVICGENSTSCICEECDGEIDEDSQNQKIVIDERNQTHQAKKGEHTHGT